MKYLKSFALDMFVGLLFLAAILALMVGIGSDEYEN